MKKLLILLTFITSSCIDFEHEGQLYLILKGKHSSNAPIVPINKNSISFECMFDESAVYDLGTEDQLDINKLIGFSFGLESHHQNSARVGWRWSLEKEKIELFAYYYLNGERFHEHLCDINPYQSFSGQISLSGDTLSFSIDSYHIEIDLSLETTSIHKNKYLLFPYFGGNRKAPHNITIALNLS